MKLLKQELYSLTKEKVNALMTDKDLCDFFEHMMIDLGVDGGHYPMGCKLCAKDPSIKELILCSRVFARDNNMFHHAI